MMISVPDMKATVGKLKARICRYRRTEDHPKVRDPDDQDPDGNQIELLGPGGSYSIPGCRGGMLPFAQPSSREARTSLT